LRTHARAAALLKLVWIFLCWPRRKHKHKARIYICRLSAAHHARMALRWRAYANIAPRKARARRSV